MELKTTFWQDFTIADAFGISAIQDTYDRAFAAWKTDTEYLTELCMVLNWKIFDWYEKNEDYANLYNKLWGDTDEYAMSHLKGKDLEYFIKTTD